MLTDLYYIYDRLLQPVNATSSHKTKQGKKRIVLVGSIPTYYQPASYLSTLTSTSEGFNSSKKLPVATSISNYR